MEKNIELKRPWTIKVFVIIFGVLFGIKLISFLTDTTQTWAFIYFLIISISIFGIWQGRNWARNLFLVLMMPFFLLTFFLALYALLNLSNTSEFRENLYLILSSILSLVLMVIPFLKRSAEWFDRELKTSSEKAKGIPWQYQLMLTVASIGVGFLAISMSPQFGFFSSFIKEWIQINHPSYWGKFAILLFSVNLSTLIGAFIVEFPFSLVLGYLKREYRFLLWRLITLGGFFPVYTTYFVLGNRTENFTFFISIALLNLITISLVALFGLAMGEKMARYVDTLRVPIEIK
ncbi:hypothetical protein [Sulfuricurvum sp. RIFCSPLOWO2_12_FULL_43_24]|uniref:hypothetical protein n=1 Tax=Sulfuricurvum sp. RIFCSPLOWO2_12_FULL_43_24 TaxID=1802247 RepID=UPI0008C6EF08|nr:hypothetical protein [Sulfuricurvum sp. RIFCSPLOWO2_12_FULL_43_24]OHD87115.1 MAG: hypothetical protein A2W83_00310 [Sulfuricurvum sp. RIFCSPLOWO2_12_43_5]OHD89201.1 MAG: hypothetical protein A3G19_07020 [Sulfuricurvum sp. RIFCSPLOWO2_12_FULL_43_24]